MKKFMSMEYILQEQEIELIEEIIKIKIKFLVMRYVMKAVFFDVDGTLIEGTHPDYRYMRENVQKAIRKLQEQGHYVFIASGRSLAFLDEKMKILVSMAMYCSMVQLYFSTIRLFIERHLKNLCRKNHIYL